MGPEPRRPVLHEHDVLGYPRAPELLQVRPARHRLLEVEVEARRMRPAPLQPVSVLGYRSGQVVSIRRRFRREEPDAVHDMPLVPGTLLLDLDPLLHFYMTSSTPHCING